MLEHIRKGVTRTITSVGTFILAHRGLGVAAAALLFIFAIGLLRPALTIVLLVGIASLSLVYNRFIQNISLGIELITLATVITGYAYGGLLAAVVGLVSLFIAEIISGTLGGKSGISFAGISIVALLLPLMKHAGWGITAAGIVATLIYDAIIIPLYLGTGSRLWKSLLFVTTHLLFNIWVFFTIAPIAYRLIA